MVNKQYKLQHTLNNNNYKNVNSTKLPSNSRILSTSSTNTPNSSFASYDYFTTSTTNSSSSDRNFLTSQKPKRYPYSSSNKKPITSSNFKNNYYSQNKIFPARSRQNAAYGQNITMSYGSSSTNGTIGTTKNNSKYPKLYRNPSDKLKSNDLTINDIGRFQYILQMDKELGTYPESYYHLSSQNHQNIKSAAIGLQPDPKSLSINSLNTENSISNFWRSESTDYPIKAPITKTTKSTSTSTSSMSSKPHNFRNRASEIFYWHKHHDLIEHSRAFCSIAKWPIILLISCLVLSCLIFLLIMMGSSASQRSAVTLQNEINDNIMSANFSDERISLTDFDDGRQFFDTDYNINHDDEHNSRHPNNHNQLDGILTILIKSRNNSLKESNPIEIGGTPKTTSAINNGVHLQEIDFELETGDDDDDDEDDEDFKEKIRIIQRGGGSGRGGGDFTTRNPLNRNTQILKFTTKKGFSPDEDIFVQSTTETLINAEHEKSRDKTFLLPILPPTKETLQVIGFTSGHQNNFGVPIEEDERILRMFNDEITKYESQEINSNSTTENPDDIVNDHSSSTTSTSSSTTTVKVSPTLPLIIHHKDTSPSRYRTTTESMIMNASNNDICESTSLDLCQGILRYDLTTAKSKRKLESMDLQHFKYLIASNCSNRAAEFICSVLEPECRSAKLGSLQPCKRICKSILEPCAGLISSSEILTITFDCDRYPDSSDRNVCEDPTRRSSKCYDNELQCLDSTCIPKQWKCDNIKDCPLGEDEDDCQFCQQDEFQCQSDGKCITDKWYCDGYSDCDDSSDEYDCDEYDDAATDEFNEEVDDDESENDDLNSKLFTLLSEQEEDTSEETPSSNEEQTNHPNSLPFLAISATDEDSNNENLKYGHNEALFGTDSIDDIKSKVNLTNKSTSKEDEEYEEIQTGEASGRIIVEVPHHVQGLGNFQDSKEIMMTSDSENDFKYSKIIRGSNRGRNATTTATTSNKRTSSASVGSTTRTTSRQTTLLRRGGTSTTISTTSTTTPLPISTKLLRTSSVISRRTTLPTTTPKASSKENSTLCPGAQLRCVSGKCINVDQLCDKIIDCPDGADEARCVYKDDNEKRN